MTTAGASVGGGITLSGGSAVLATPGTYQVSYTFAADSSQNELVSAYLRLNGTEVVGSRSLSTTTGGLDGAIDDQVSLVMMITTTSANSVLGLYTSTNTTNTGSLPAYLIASLNIVRIS